MEQAIIKPVEKELIKSELTPERQLRIKKKKKKKKKKIEKKKKNKKIKH